MQKYRTEKVMKNSFVSILTQLFILLLGFINRSVFVKYMDIEYLGYSNLFTNIFNLLNVTELGIGGIITFHLYKAFAEDNTVEISKLMKLYKDIYRAIAFIVITLGIIIYFFLPYIIKDNSFDWKYIYIIYLIQLAGTVAGYFLSYMRTMFITDQMEYKTLVADLCSKFLTQILQMIIIIIWQNFIVYMVMGILNTVIANIIITVSTYRHYSYIRHNKAVISKEDIKRWNIISDVQNFLVHKVAGAVYFGTDNVVISAICGIKNVALYGNYYLLQSQVNSIILYRLLNPVQATIGNYIYSESNLENQRKTFLMLDTFCYWLASYATAGFLLFYQPFIKFWLGSEYLLSSSFVIAFSLTSFLGISGEILWKYRSTFGSYNKDRNEMILSAVLNIVSSVILAKLIGMVGVQIGTILGFLPILYGRMKLVVGDIMKMSKKYYMWEHFKYLVLELIQCVVMITIVSFVGKGLCNIIMRILMVFFVPTIFNYIYFRKKDSFRTMLVYIKRVLCITTDKFKHYRK